MNRWAQFKQRNNERQKSEAGMSRRTFDSQWRKRPCRLSFKWVRMFWKAHWTCLNKPEPRTKLTLQLNIQKDSHGNDQFSYILCYCKLFVFTKGTYEEEGKETCSFWVGRKKRFLAIGHIFCSKDVVRAARWLIIYSKTTDLRSSWPNWDMNAWNIEKIFRLIKHVYCDLCTMAYKKLFLWDFPFLTYQQKSTIMLSSFQRAHR